MPRRPPGAVRAQQTPVGHRSRIAGLSARTITALAQFDHRRRWPGCTAAALQGYRRLLRQRGRWLDLEPEGCSCCGGPLDHRDNLEAALEALPTPERAELRRLIAPLDDNLFRRSIPDPFWRPADGPYADRWWHHRMID